MANTYQDNSTHKSRRYTIPQLLRLACHRRPFDLSKFSYDAARAGVVPPLEDCAMSSRRSSANRPRGWSIASMDTNEDIVVVQGNINSAKTAQPDRQPYNPPTESKNQQDEGFAKFLRKHSSPTHNRVTAGGRIVPMEKCESPPKFSLQASLVPADAVQVCMKQESVSPTQQPHFPGYSAEVQHHHKGTLVSAVNVKQEQDTQTAGNSPAVPDVNSSSGAQQHPSHIKQTGTTPHCMLGDPYNGFMPPVALQGSLNYLTPQGPYLPYQPAIPYPAYPWQYTDTYSLPALNSAAIGPLDFHAHMIYATQQSVADAEALFQNLDRQLKLIDRHRAMNSHDRDLSAQRMAIVHQRAEAKDTIHRLKAQLHVEQGQARQPGSMPMMTSMPPVFVPRAVISGPHTSTNPANTSSLQANGNASVEKVQLPSKRKVIPIVPPPSASPIQAEPSKKTSRTLPNKLSAESQPPQQSSQDEDAARIRDSDLVQSSSSKTTRSPQPSVERPTLHSDHKAAWSTKSDSKADDQRKMGKGVFDLTEWMGTKTGRAPKDVEAVYELQLDAMRLPTNMVVSIPLLDGTLIQIPGSNMGKPSSTLMSEFEQEYWDRKPTFTLDMLYSLRRKATIYDPASLSDAFIVAHADGPPASPFKRASESKHQERVQKHVEEQSKCLQNCAPLSHVRTKGEVSMSFDSMPQVVPAAITQTTVVSVSTTPRLDSGARSDVESMILGELSNKGFSSVGIQNINAEIRLPPPSFDGAVDGSRRDAVSSLTAAGKSRSPRLLHRSTPAGGT